MNAWADVPEELRKPGGCLSQSMFPVGASTGLASGCIRLYPHHIDGSGFFIAVFVKEVHRASPASLPVGLPPLEDRVKLLWRARNESNRYEVVAADAPDVRSIADFYGLDEVPSPLIAEYNVKGRLTQLNLVNDALLHLLRCHLNCKGSPLLVSVGVPLFKLIDENFMTNIELPSRWRPALEGCTFLSSHMSRRALRLDAKYFKTLLAHRLLPMEELQLLADAGSLTGLDGCRGLLGGAVVGLLDGSFWAPCIITGRGVELYANSDELGEPVPVLLPSLRPAAIGSGPGYVAFSKPSGLRTEDVLRFMQESHAEAELVSRLDKQTSGCLVVASTREGAVALTQQFSQGSVQKTYLALVWGQPPEVGRVDAPLALAEEGGGQRYRAYVSEKGKASSTAFRTLWRSGGAALLAAFPKTGRTHQIRCHMAHIGCPLVGDSKYGSASASWCGRLPLHCLRVQALDVDGAALDVRAHPTSDFEALCRSCWRLDSTASGLQPVDSGQNDGFDAEWGTCINDLLYKPSENCGCFDDFPVLPQG